MAAQKSVANSGGGGGAARGWGRALLDLRAGQHLLILQLASTPLIAMCLFPALASPHEPAVPPHVIDDDLALAWRSHGMLRLHAHRMCAARAEEVATLEVVLAASYAQLSMLNLHLLLRVEASAGTGTGAVKPEAMQSHASLCARLLSRSGYALSDVVVAFQDAAPLSVDECRLRAVVARLSTAVRSLILSKYGRVLVERHYCHV